MLDFDAICGVPEHLAILLLAFDAWCWSACKDDWLMMIAWLFSWWLTDWLIDWWLIDWFIHWLIDSLIDDWLISSWSSRGFEVNWGTIALVGSPEQTPRVARGRENAARRSPWTLKWSRPKNSKKCGRVVQKYGCQEKGILRYWVADSWHPYFFDDLVLLGLHFAAKMTPRYAKMTVDGAKWR